MYRHNQSIECIHFEYSFKMSIISSESQKQQSFNTEHSVETLRVESKWLMFRGLISVEETPFSLLENCTQFKLQTKYCELEWRNLIDYSIVNISFLHSNLINGKSTIKWMRVAVNCFHRMKMKNRTTYEHSEQKNNEKLV